MVRDGIHAFASISKLFTSFETTLKHQSLIKSSNRVGKHIITNKTTERLFKPVSEDNHKMV